MTRIQIRRDTSVNWATYNPILADGEFALETDTRKIKIGNGEQPYTELAYQGDSELEKKANTDFSNASIPYITSKYRNGNSWYRIWSDGWLEQGGTSSAGYNSPVTVSFIKQYDAVPLTVTMIAANASADGNPNQSRIATIVSRNSDKFIYTVSTPSAQSTVPIIWSASGYIIGGENEL